MTTGFIHRVVLTREVKLHAHLGHPAAFEMITDQFFAPMVMISLCYSVVFTFCAIHVETPGIKAYAAAAAAGMLCDGIGAVRVFRQDFALGDAIGSHACSLEALPCV
jgi:hypothetical protein